MVDQPPVPSPAQPRQIGRAPPPSVSPPSSQRTHIIIGGVIIVLIAGGAWFLGRSSKSEATNQPAATHPSQPSGTTSAETQPNIANEEPAEPDLISWPQDKAPMPGIPKLAWGTWRGLEISNDEGKTFADLTNSVMCIVTDQQIKVASGKVLTVNNVISINGKKGKGFVVSFFAEEHLLWFVSLLDIPDHYLVQEMVYVEDCPLLEQSRFTVVNKH